MAVVVAVEAMGVAGGAVVTAGTVAGGGVGMEEVEVAATVREVGAMAVVMVGAEVGRKD